MRSYGLVGYPLSHSFSRGFFTEKFARENKQEEYLNFEIPEIGFLPGIIERHSGLAGLNITIPFKEKVVPLMNTLDSVSSQIKAVNTVRINRRAGKILLEGFNTDVYGFTQSISPLLKSWHKGALVLGTGGASKAVTFALQKLGIQTLLVSRDPLNTKVVSYGDIDREMIMKYTVIVNTTPLGTFPAPEASPELPYHFLTSVHLLFDLVYNPPETKFLALGRAQGATVKNGYEMLLLQALKSYEIWNSPEKTEA